MICWDFVGNLVDLGFIDVIKLEFDFGVEVVVNM